MKRKFWVFTVIISSCLMIFLLLFSDDSVAIMKKRDKDSIHIYLIGDSTVSTYKPKLAPRMGWGQKLNDFFHERVVVHNASIPGRSSKSFYDEGRFQKVKREISQGDYLFIQFGHNDAKKADVKRYTDPFTTYKMYLKKYIDEAREKGAIPILVTPVERRNFSKQGNIIDSHGNYPSAMKQLAVEENVELIDLTTKSKQLFNKIGPENTKKLFLWLEPFEYKHFPEGKKDNTHLQEQGAYTIASLIVEGLVEINSPLKEYVKQD
ncbi:rhamnogalacturonan acetylesterase [Metabacillus halosaccharovorans]|uniref:rhamnogalacturonan acetylesterase n=1 Tax=Metabacillus halosaccharovorans TaxID=930124 RepID=UPI00203B42F3|nr:rhamnogalacturonan acetylesterase [Metabacillus halosaccharovorans]MCM3439712.1 rhamnogalacturonan acetylesterase [Metabacillus halosaccharovorans]